MVSGESDIQEITRLTEWLIFNIAALQRNQLEHFFYKPTSLTRKKPRISNNKARTVALLSFISKVFEVGLFSKMPIFGRNLV